MEVHKQNALFQYFSDTFDHLIAADKREGKYDMGILGKPCGDAFPWARPQTTAHPTHPLTLCRPGPWH